MHLLIIHHVLTVAGCFPNCTPDPSTGVGGSSPIQQSGNAALGAAALLLAGSLLWKLLFGKNKSSK